MPLTACTMLSKPRRARHGPAVAPRGERNADDARTQRRQRLRREAAPARARRDGRTGRKHRPCCTSLRKRRRAFARGADRGAPTACRCRCRSPPAPESGRCSALILSTSAPNARPGSCAQVGPGEHAREVEHPHAGERPLGPPRRLGRRFADARDLEQRLRGDCLRLRMPLPLSSLRTKPAHPPAAWIASSAPRRSTRGLWPPPPCVRPGACSTASAASRWFGKLQWMLIQPSCTR